MNHDRSYKFIFSNREMMYDLLTGFVHEPWVEEVDFSTLSRMPNSYVSDDLRERLDDIVWRVNIQGRPSYVYILLEFQSEVEPYMALRLMIYLGLLYQDLIAAGQVPRGSKLPPVFPIVLYNGQARWRAKRNVDELIEPGPGGLLAYMPHLRYFLLEIGAVDEAAQLAMHNLVALLMRLEKSKDAQSMLDAMHTLQAWLRAPGRTRLRRSFTVWIRRVLLPSRLPGVNPIEIGNILEENSMLAERVMEWTAQWKAEGKVEGKVEGKAEGKAELLQMLLEARFGPLPEWVLARLRSAREEELAGWSLRLLNQASLTDILN